MYDSRKSSTAGVIWVEILTGVLSSLEGTRVGCDPVDDRIKMVGWGSLPWDALRRRGLELCELLDMGKPDVPGNP